MAVPDPVDARLLALLAEVGRVAVHDLAKRANLDVREVAARLAALAAGGLPLVVGVECDPAALRYALSTGGWPAGGTPGQPGYRPQYAPPPGGGPYGPGGGTAAQTFSPGTAGPPPSPGAAGTGLQPDPLPFSPAAGPRSFGADLDPQPSGPSAEPGSFTPVGFPGGPSPAGPAPATAGWTEPEAVGVDPVGTWGPPGSAAWARSDDLETRTVRTTPTRRARTGAVGDTLHTDGLAVQLVEVVDPADFLFTAAGYKLQPGERSVVVHTELTNRGSAPFGTLPDLYLVLLDGEGRAVSKAPVSLSSRPPHRIGVKPGETAGGHTVYVLPEATELAAVRWSPRPDDEHHTLTWTVREQ